MAGLKVEIAETVLAIQDCSNKISDLKEELAASANKDHETDSSMVESTNITDLQGELSELLDQFHTLSVKETELRSKMNETPGTLYISPPTAHKTEQFAERVTSPLLKSCADSGKPDIDNQNASPAQDQRQHRTSTSLLHLAKPPCFKGEKGESISTFLEKFQHFITLGNIRDPNLDFYLLNLVKDPKTYRKLKAIKLTPVQKGDINLLILAIESALLPDSEIRSLRTELSSLKQDTSESLEDFAFRVEELSIKAFSNEEMREEGALSAFLEGIRNLDLKQKLLESDSANTFIKTKILAFKLDKIATSLKQRSDDQSILHIAHREQGPNHSLSRNDRGSFGNNPPNNYDWRQNRNYNNNDDSAIANSNGGTFRNFSRPRQTQRRYRNLNEVQCWTCRSYGHYSYNCDQPPAHNNRPQGQNRQNHLNYRQAGVSSTSTMAHSRRDNQ